jgi:Arc/MetJ-type ribon-helix-helix transcriptional regulator
MAELHYGVVQQNGRWIIIGQNLRYGAYKHRSSAVRAARRLAEQALGRPVTLHIQDEAGSMLRPQKVADEV